MKHQLGEIWKDSFTSRYPWRVQMPKGILPCETKKKAIAFSKSVCDGSVENNSRCHVPDCNQVPCYDDAAHHMQLTPGGTNR